MGDFHGLAGVAGGRRWMFGSVTERGAVDVGVLWAALQALCHPVLDHARMLGDGAT